jgi:hypothetical protein
MREVIDVGAPEQNLIVDSSLFIKGFIPPRTPTVEITKALN